MPAKEERNQLLSINTRCGDVDGKSVRSVCCNKHGRFLTIQVKNSEQKSLEIGKILVHVAAPGCAEDDDENLCALVAEPEVYDENIFNDDRNDGSCIPTTTTTSTTTTSTTTTSTTTLCDPTTLSRGDIEVENKPCCSSAWRLVRHVPEGSRWHPATDNLVGTEEYGNKLDQSQPFSVKWGTSDYNQVREEIYGNE